MKQGFLQALGVSSYISLIGFLMFNASKVLPKQDNFMAPISFLLLFSVSALVCGLIVFYKPYTLFFANKKKEAVNIVVSTAVWLFVFLVVSFSLMILFK